MRSILVTLFVLLALPACSEGPFAPVPEAQEHEIRAALDDRSFRQFDPSRDGSPRKGVVIDFFNGVELWAQYAEGEHAIDEWQIIASDYRLEQTDDGSIVRIHFTSPRSVRNLPAACRDCIPHSEVTISIRDVFDADRIRFRIDDPEGSLPSPFPVFGSWTRFEEDVYFD